LSIFVEFFGIWEVRILSLLIKKSERLKMNKEVIIDKINNFLIDEFEVDADDISPMPN